LTRIEALGTLWVITKIVVGKRGGISTRLHGKMVKDRRGSAVALSTTIRKPRREEGREGGGGPPSRLA